MSSDWGSKEEDWAAGNRAIALLAFSCLRLSADHLGLGFRHQNARVMTEWGEQWWGSSSHLEPLLFTSSQVRVPGPNSTWPDWNGCAAGVIRPNSQQSSRAPWYAFRQVVKDQSSALKAWTRIRSSQSQRTPSHRRPDGDDAGDPPAAAEAGDARRPQLRAGGERRRGPPADPQNQPRRRHSRARCPCSGGRRRLLHEVRLPRRSSI